MKLWNGCDEKPAMIHQTEKTEFHNLLMMPLSRNHILSLVSLVKQRPELIEWVIDLLKNGQKAEAMKASWLLTHLWDADQSFFIEIQNQIIEAVLSTSDDSVRRNLLRMIDGFSLSEDQQGMLFEPCLEWMVSEKYAVAVRANAMQILYRIALREPDLIPELEQQISSLMDYSSAGIRSRGKKILSSFRKRLQTT